MYSIYLPLAAQQLTDVEGEWGVSLNPTYPQDQSPVGWLGVS